jgi:hypothetical protein
MLHKCLVASALGHDDVDALYDEVIKPLLKDLDVVALRVDRVEHNDDIDDRIFALLNSASFCIADLTYARPSVYYEAGYAAGQGKPVIYVVRADHFRRRSHVEDPYGNLRVHFDLQMKNIIDWDDSSARFRERLARRVRFVLRGLRPTSSTPRIQDPFARLSIRDRQERLARIAHAIFIRHGFSPIHSGAVLRKGVRGTQVALRSKDDALSVWIIATDRITQREMDFWKPASRFQPPPPRERAHIVIVSLTAAKGDRLHRLLPEYERIGDFAFRSSPRRHHEGGIRDSTYHFITGVDSIAAYQVQISQLAVSMRSDLRRQIHLPAANGKRPGL